MVICQVGRKNIFLYKEETLMISFKPFWNTLDRYKISTYSLINDYHISSSTINRLRHNQAVSTATVNKLCKILDVDVWSIMEFKSDEQS